MAFCNWVKSGAETLAKLALGFLLSGRALTGSFHLSNLTRRKSVMAPKSAVEERSTVFQLRLTAYENR